MPVPPPAARARRAGAPPPNPNASALTTVPTPRRYEDNENGIVVSLFTKANAPVAPPFRRCDVAEMTGQADEFGVATIEPPQQCRPQNRRDHRFRSRLQPGGSLKSVRPSGTKFQTMDCSFSPGFQQPG